MRRPDVDLGKGSATAEPSQVSEDELAQPTGTEDCDRCVAKAWVRTYHRGGIYLDWCAHHYDDNAEVLINGSNPATHVLDNRRVLQEQEAGAR